MARLNTTLLAGIVVLASAAAAAGAPGTGTDAGMGTDPSMGREAEAEAGTGPSGAEAARVVSLSRALTTALERNFHLSVTRVDNDLADQRFLLQTGAFDQKIGFTTTWEDQSRRSSSLISGASSLESNNRLYQLALTQPLQDGSTLAWTLSNGRASSNSTWATINPAFAADFGLSYTRPLARGAGRKVAMTLVRVADLGRQQTWAGFVWDASATLLQVEAAYWDLVATTELLEVRRGTLSQAEDLVRTNAERVRQGLLARNEVLVIEAKASAAARRDSVIVAEDALDDARERLGLLMGLDAKDSLGLRPGDRPEDAAPSGTFDSAGAVAAALNARPDVLQAQLNLQGKDLGTQYYRNQRRPSVNFKSSVDLAGTAGDRAETATQIVRAQYPTYLVGFEVSVPFHGRVDEANLRQAELQAEQVRRSIVELTRTIESDVRRAVAQVETNDRRLEAATLSLDLAERKLAAQTERYHQGLLTTHDLLDYQEQLAQARSTLLNARVDKAKSLATVAHLTGGYLEARSLKLERAPGK